MLPDPRPSLSPVWRLSRHGLCTVNARGDQDSARWLSTHPAVPPLALKTLLLNSCWVRKCRSELTPLASSESPVAASRPTLRYCTQTEGHVYALAVSASALLSFYPFLVVMLSFCRKR